MGMNEYTVRDLMHITGWTKIVCVGYLRKNASSKKVIIKNTGITFNGGRKQKVHVFTLNEQQSKYINGLRGE